MDSRSRPAVVVGRIERLGPEVVLSPFPAPPRRLSKGAQAKLQRLLDAARVYRDKHSQKALDELLDAAKDIE